MAFYEVFYNYNGGCIGCRVLNKVYIYTHIRYTGGILRGIGISSNFK